MRFPLLERLGGELKWNLISHLKRTKEALRAFAFDEKSECDTNVSDRKLFLHHLQKVRLIMHL